MQSSGCNEAQWLSWLERRPVTAEARGSSPLWVVFLSAFLFWGLSSAGRAPALQAGGHRFEPCRPHVYIYRTFCRCGSMAEQLICNQQVEGSSPPIGFCNRCIAILLTRGRAVWKLVGLITRRSEVQILPPLLLKEVSDLFF